MIRRSAGMRYRGQSYEVSVPVDELRTADDLAELQQRFHAAHQRRYGHMAQAEAVEIVNFSVTAIGLIPKPEPKTFELRSTGTPAPSSTRRAFFNATEAQGRAGVPARYIVSRRADRGAGHHRGDDLDHRPLSRAASDDRQLSEHRNSVERRLKVVRLFGR